MYMIWACWACAGEENHGHKHDKVGLGRQKRSCINTAFLDKRCGSVLFINSCLLLLFRKPTSFDVFVELERPFRLGDGQ